MTATGKFSLRLAIYSVVLAFVVGDLFVFNGPLRRKIERNRPDSPESIAAAKAGGAVARVFHHPITRAQLEYAVHNRLRLENRDPAGLSESERKFLRYAALGDLIDHQLLRLKAKANTTEAPVTDGEVDARLAVLAGRFESSATMEVALASRNLGTLQDFRDRIAARIQQEKYVELRVAPLAEVTEEEAESWFQENSGPLATPERVEARHIFLRTLETPPEEAREKLEETLAALKEGTKDFATLASEISEDPSTKDRGGMLGWLTRGHLSPDFAEPLFSMAPGEPQLIRTKTGWHLVEVTTRKDAEPRSFEEAKPEILATLESAKRRQATHDYRAALRQFEDKYIEIFHDMMEE